MHRVGCYLLLTNLDNRLSSRNFEELCKVLAMIFDLRKFQNEAVNKIIVRIVASLEECLINNSFTLEMANDLTVSVISLIARFS